MTKAPPKIKKRRISGFVFEEWSSCWVCFPFDKPKFERDRFHGVRAYKPQLSINDGVTILANAHASWASFVCPDNEMATIYGHAIIAAARLAQQLNEEIEDENLQRKRV